MSRWQPHLRSPFLSEKQKKSTTDVLNWYTKCGQVKDSSSNHFQGIII